MDKYYEEQLYLPMDHTQRDFRLPELPIKDD